ncbi:phage tail tip lysozyme [Kribbella solani]|uniref:phage tail tip lysozyme n=1 Tax=Kribbella solani TaxID=236067 RepID=UPI0029BD11A9|nr:phage tail tip lysozyme [Kribbella solani]MDX2973151.1 phage tail tip lysozyme [Kribbella solani]MDX3003973.1 phage tail tip lysozyme [Kribbella solani]
MADTKGPQMIGGCLVVLALPLIVVIVMILGVLGNWNASAASCETSDAGDQPAFAWPTEKKEVSKEWSDKDSNGDSHPGYDFDVKEGSKVFAAGDGKVVSIDNNEIQLEHGEGIQTRYKYLKSISVTVGKDVKRGDQIGTSGSHDEDSPGMTGAHLHFELWVKQDDGKLGPVKVPDNPFGDAKPANSGCGCGNQDLTGANNQQQAFNYLVQNGYSKEQAAGIVGNMIAESQVQPTLLNDGTATGTLTSPADAVNTGRAWGLVQWYPASKMINAARSANVDDKTIGSLAFQLDFVRKQLIGEGPLPEKEAGDQVKATKTPGDAAYAFGRYFERFSLDPNAAEYDNRRANAKRVFDTFAGSAPASGSGGGGGCGAGSGNIAEVAKNLAWPQDGHNGVAASIAKPEYVAAMEKYNDGSSGIDPYSDCGRFVATVMHMSGADPDYPNVSTDTQRIYLESSGKYLSWHGEPQGGMQPGDILNGPGHTYLYVGPWGDGNGYNAAAASLHGHVPEADHLYGVGGQFTVYRLKSAWTPSKPK